jgi:CheY-like chemotaxis protein
MWEGIGMTESRKRKAELIRELDALRGRIESFEAERKESDQVEEMMWQTQVALATLIDNLPGIAYRTAYDDEGKPHVVFVSAGCRTVAEQETADFIADPSLYRDVIVHPEDRDRVKKAIVDAVAEKESYDLTYRIRTPNGVEKWVSERGFGLFNDAGRLIAREGFITDITDRVRPLEQARMECERLRDRLDETILELRILKSWTGQKTDHPRTLEDLTQSQLMRSQRFEALGTLAGGIAHDFNNLLQAIIGYTKLAGEADTPAERTETYLTRILEASTRARQLVAQILTFCKQAEQEPSRQPVQKLVEEGVRMLRASLPSTIDLTTSLEAGKATVLVDPTRFSQVFITLCANASRQLLVDGGRLAVTLRTVDSLPEGAGTGNLPAGPHAAVVVEAALAPDSVSSGDTPLPAFEGIGLDVLEEIAQHQGGTIVTEEVPPHSYTCTLYLPLSSVEPASVQTGEQEEQTQLPEGGGEHILFVDDEEMLVELGELVAEDLGYRVTACTSSVDALRKFEDDPASFDLVLTDQTMPHLTGFELAGKMLAIRPDIPIILTTGYSEVVNELQARAIGIREYLMKPITPENLAEAIRHVLDQSNDG